MLVYVDTSAMAKRLRDEQESDALEEHLRDVRTQEHTVISSALLDVELARLGVRDDIDAAEIERVLSDVRRVGIFPEVIESAKRIVQDLKSLDAIHVGTALLLVDEDEGEEAVEQIITYDARMCAVAEELGFDVVSPGRP